MTPAKRITLSLGAALAVLLFFAIVSWLSGYNFDHRSRDVGELTGVAMLLSALAAAFVYAITEQRPKP